MTTYVGSRNWTENALFMSVEIRESSVSRSPTLLEAIILHLVGLRPEASLGHPAVGWPAEGRVDRLAELPPRSAPTSPQSSLPTSDSGRSASTRPGRRCAASPGPSIPHAPRGRRIAPGPSPLPTRSLPGGIAARRRWLGERSAAVENRN